MTMSHDLPCTSLLHQNALLKHGTCNIINNISFHSVHYVYSEPLLMNFELLPHILLNIVVTNINSIVSK